MPWSEADRAKYDVIRERYSSDLSESEFALIFPLLPAPKRRGRKPTCAREILNALFYLIRAGCPWRLLPNDFPPFTTVQNRFYAWRDSGLWTQIVCVLVMGAREAEGRDAAPTAVVVDSQSVKTTLEALDQAMAARNPAPDSLIHHSDRGVQYACSDYVERLEARKIAISMSRPGNPYDNAKAESFMKTLKTEEVNGKAYATIEAATHQIADFIETIYNRQRLHSALGYKPPVEFEAELRPVTPALNQDEALSLN